MGGEDATRLRAAVLHLDRYRLAIEAEVDRRIGRAEPSPHARIEIVRRFRTFCRLASLDLRHARPSLDGLGGCSVAGLELAVQKAVEVAIECGADDEMADRLRWLGEGFRNGLRRLMKPEESQRKTPRGRRHKTPNAGRRVRGAIDRISDAYFALCLDTGKLFDVNPAAETLLGIDASQLLEYPLVDLIVPAERETYRSLEARLEAGEDSEPVQLHFRRTRGDDIHVQASIANHTIGNRRLAIFVAREKTIPPLRERPSPRESRAPREVFPGATPGHA